MKLTTVALALALFVPAISGADDKNSLIEISTDSDLDMILQNRKASLQRHADGARELQKADSVSIK